GEIAEVQRVGGRETADLPHPDGRARMSAGKRGDVRLRDHELRHDDVPAREGHFDWADADAIELGLLDQGQLDLRGPAPAAAGTANPAQRKRARSKRPGAWM